MREPHDSRNLADASKAASKIPQGSRLKTPRSSRDIASIETRALARKSRLFQRPSLAALGGGQNGHDGGRRARRRYILGRAIHPLIGSKVTVDRRQNVRFRGAPMSNAGTKMLGRQFS
jgi:hypothetical protein